MMTFSWKAANVVCHTVDHSGIMGGIWYLQKSGCDHGVKELKACFSKISAKFSFLPLNVSNAYP